MYYNCKFLHNGLTKLSTLIDAVFQFEQGYSKLMLILKERENSTGSGVIIFVVKLKSAVRKEDNYFFDI